MTARLRLSTISAAAACLGGWGCGLSTTMTFGTDASMDAESDSGDVPVLGGDDGDCAAALCPPCFGCPPQPTNTSCPPGSPLSCYVNTNCPDGGSTRVIGTVYDPAGVNPLPNVVVFVPNDPTLLPTLDGGVAACKGCVASIQDYAALAVTDATGHFTLPDVPTGNNVPVILQTDKWRRIVSVPKTEDCRDTMVAQGSFRLPRSHKEGDLPQMAVLTGGCDDIACFLRNVGIDPTEFTAPHAGGKVDVYQGLGAAGPAAALSNGVAGDCTTPACPLWASKSSLEAYDDVLLGCECDAHDETKSAASLQALHDYIAEGGTVFATHSQTTWFKNGPADFQSLAGWIDGPASGATGPFAIDTTPPRGMLLADWLATVGAGDASGLVSLDPATVSTSVTTVAPNVSAWIYDRGTATDAGGAPSDMDAAPSGADADALSSTDAGGLPLGNVKAFSVYPPASTDAGSVNACRAGVINVTDVHAGEGAAVQGADGSAAPASVPAACTSRQLTAGEKVLEYLLFRSSGTCVGSQVLPPPPRPGG